MGERWEHCGQETTWLHGRIRAGAVKRGDLVALPTRSDRPFVTRVADLQINLHDALSMAWDEAVGEGPSLLWLVLLGIPVAQDVLCPGTAYGQDPPVS